MMINAYNMLVNTMDQKWFEAWEEIRFTSHRCLTNPSSLYDVRGRGPMLFHERIERCDKELEPFLQQKERIPQMIQYLRKYYATRLWYGDRAYLNKRIAEYESSLPVRVKHPSFYDEQECLSRKKKPGKTYIGMGMRRKVWNDTFGKEVGSAMCYCCKENEITQLAFVCGHVLAEVNGGETKPSNLKPICGSCNSNMGIRHMDEYMDALNR